MKNIILIRYIILRYHFCGIRDKMKNSINNCNIPLHCNISNVTVQIDYRNPGLNLDRILKTVYIIISKSAKPLLCMLNSSGCFYFINFSHHSSKLPYLLIYIFSCIAYLQHKIIYDANFPIFATQTQFSMIY